MRRVAWIAWVLLGLAFGVAWGQGPSDDDLAPLLSDRELASAMGARLAERQQSAPSSLTRDVFREYRRWLAVLSRKGLEGDFAAEIRDRSRQMAEIIAGRFDELVDECLVGNASVAAQMRELVTWTVRYPALVQQLGPSWLPMAEEEIRRCGLPNWYGVVGAGQPDAFSEGYYGSAEVTWYLDAVDANGLVATYRPVVTLHSFVIPPEECQVYTIERVTPNTAQSFLRVDFEVTPAAYQGALFFDVAITITDPCDRETPPFRMNQPFPIMFAFDEWRLTNATQDEIDGSYLDQDTLYQSRWNFTAVERGD